MDLTGVLPIAESGAERLAEGDHIGEDGLVYCGKCGSKKQLRVKFGDKTHVVRCVCKCESKELEEKKRQEEYEEQMRRINRLKEASMMDAEIVRKYGEEQLRRRQHHFESRFADEAGLGAEWRGRLRRS